MINTGYCMNNCTNHCVKYARIRVFSDPHFPVLGLILRFSPYTGKCGSEKAHTLAHLTHLAHLAL